MDLVKFVSSHSSPNIFKRMIGTILSAINQSKKHEIHIWVHLKKKNKNALSVRHVWFRILFPNTRIPLILNTPQKPWSRGFTHKWDHRMEFNSPTSHLQLGFSENLGQNLQFFGFEPHFPIFPPKKNGLGYPLKEIFQTHHRPRCRIPEQPSDGTRCGWSEFGDRECPKHFHPQRFLHRCPTLW